MRPANGVFTSVQGFVTAKFKVPQNYTLDGSVKVKTPLSETLFPATTAFVTTENGVRLLLATFDMALIDNNMPAGSDVPLVVTANFMHEGVQKQLASTATVRVIK
jgi:quinohemoprotein ethanol dehydrogenase